MAHFKMIILYVDIPSPSTISITAVSSSIVTEASDEEAITENDSTPSNFPSSIIETVRHMTVTWLPQNVREMEDDTKSSPPVYIENKTF